jgi:hypothetical protein
MGWPSSPLAFGKAVCPPATGSFKYSSKVMKREGAVEPLTGGSTPQSWCASYFWAGSKGGGGEGTRGKGGKGGGGGRGKEGQKDGRMETSDET